MRTRESDANQPCSRETGAEVTLSALLTGAIPVRRGLVTGCFVSVPVLFWAAYTLASVVLSKPVHHIQQRAAVASFFGVDARQRILRLCNNAASIYLVSIFSGC